jgi:hypothetical protein
VTATAPADVYAVRESRLLMAAVTDQKSYGYDSFCIFCGSRCHGRACPSHRDLLLIEQQAQRAS